MFSSLLNRISNRTLVLENYLNFCDLIDDASSDSTSPFYDVLTRINTTGVDLKEEKIFRHCAIVTQLYSLYETFAESVLSIWLSRLPSYYIFNNLPYKFRNTYRFGIGRMIQDIEKWRYRHLSLSEILDKYMNSLQGSSKWELITDAITYHRENLRRNELESMFNSAGLESFWRSLETNTDLQSFIVESDFEKNLEQLILDLVNYRNEASHGTPDDLLGSNTLRTWIQFVKILCNAIVHVVTHQIILSETEFKPQCVLGEVIKTYSGNIFIAKCERGILKVGDNIYFVRESECTLAEIQSLQLNGVDHQEIRIDQNGMEIGICTSKRIRRRALLVKIDPLGIIESNGDLETDELSWMGRFS